MKRLAAALAALAAFLVLLPLAWGMHFAYKPRGWRALLALFCWLPAEWSHSAFIYTLRWQGRLFDALIRGLRAARPEDPSLAGECGIIKRTEDDFDWCEASAKRCIPEEFSVRQITPSNGLANRQMET